MAKISPEDKGDTNLQGATPGGWDGPTGGVHGDFLGISMVSFWDMRGEFNGEFMVSLW